MTVKEKMGAGLCLRTTPGLEETRDAARIRTQSYGAMASFLSALGYAHRDEIRRAILLRGRSREQVCPMVRVSGSWKDDSRKDDSRQETASVPQGAFFCGACAAGDSDRQGACRPEGVDAQVLGSS